MYEAAEDFNWYDNRECVVVPEQPEIAVYRNPDGFIVIRQNSYPEEDHLVIVDPINLDRIIEAMRVAAGSHKFKALPKPQNKEEDRASGDLLAGVANG